MVTTVERRTAQAGAAVGKLKQTLTLRTDLPPIVVPILRMSVVESSVTLADITDLDVFRKLGSSLATDPDVELSRTLVSAIVVTGHDGMKHTALAVLREVGLHLASLSQDSTWSKC